MHIFVFECDRSEGPGLSGSRDLYLLPALLRHRGLTVSGQRKFDTSVGRPAGVLAQCFPDLQMRLSRCSIGVCEGYDLHQITSRFRDQFSFSVIFYFERDCLFCRFFAVYKSGTRFLGLLYRVLVRPRFRKFDLSECKGLICLRDRDLF